MGGYTLAFEDEVESYLTSNTVIAYHCDIDDRYPAQSKNGS